VEDHSNASSPHIQFNLQSKQTKKEFEFSEHIRRRFYSLKKLQSCEFFKKEKAIQSKIDLLCNAKSIKIEAKSNKDGRAYVPKFSSTPRQSTKHLEPIVEPIMVKKLKLYQDMKARVIEKAPFLKKIVMAPIPIHRLTVNFGNKIEYVFSYWVILLC